MKRWLLLAVTVLLALTLIACGGEGAKQVSTQQGAGEKVQPKGSGGNSLEEIQAKAKQIKELSFEMVTNVGGDQPVNSTGKMFISGEKVRTEIEAMGVRMITIVDAERNVYIYDPANNNAMKMPAAEEEIGSPGDWAEETSDMEVIGEEKLDGFDCLVIQGVSEEMESKIWVRKDIGMPVKVEIADKHAVIEYKNYKIGPQDPALFEIPADAAITELPSMPKTNP